MNEISRSRRQTLKQLASLTVLGAAGSLRILPATAGSISSGASIPGVQGTIIARDNEHYEIWRQSMVWHRSKPGRYPDLIVQARSEQDIIAAVNHARNKSLKIAIRSTGHNSSGPSLRDGGMLIDLSTLSDIHIDPDRRLASIQPGIRSQQLVIAAREYGLTFPVPHCPSVGMSGFTMGGGIGWNYTQQGGMACFSIESAEVITADGRKVEASAEQNPDLLWAIRGAGPGFFGVVTRLDLQLYPVPKSIMVNSYIHSLNDLATVTAALDDLMHIKDDRVEVLAILMHNPEAPTGTPSEQAKVCFVTAFAFGNSDEESASMLAPFAQSPLATKSLVKTENETFTFEGLYERFFSLNEPAGRMARYLVDNVMTDEPGKVLHALADHFRTAPTEDAHVLVAYGMNLKLRADACYSSIANAYLGCYAIWDSEDNDDLNYSWLEKALPLMDQYAKGHYVNEVEPRLNPKRIGQCYSAENWMRLQELRQKYDPHQVFHTWLGYA